MLVAVALLVLSYLVGAVPFGYLMAWAKGVDLFAVGSGNIGATNVGRTLGRKYGAAAFALDFLKGAVPVGGIVPLANLLDPAAPDALGHPDALRVGAGLLAFLGHLYPVYLRFRGGKGVATGAGVMAVLVPGPFAVAFVTWLSVTLASRYVSLGSIAAAVALVAARFASTPQPFQHPDWIVTAFCLVGAGLVIVKHRGNMRRLAAGTESQIKDSDMRLTLLRCLHLFAVGLWFGSAAFFNFVAAVPIFDSFKQVVATQPSDRTGFVRILPDDAPQADKDALASALAGSAVGPLFPRFFALSAVCAVVAVATAAGFRKIDAGRATRWRLILCVIAAALVAGVWPISEWVSRLRVERFHPEESVRTAAKAAFGTWHLVSLFGSGVTTVIVGVVLALGGKLPSGLPRPGGERAA
ncbi:MAG: glycerol-3-phosphate 1-O-acyltransferase PlsY [Gemmataceae bacterium]